MSHQNFFSAGTDGLCVSAHDHPRTGGASLKRGGWGLLVLGFVTTFRPVAGVPAGRIAPLPDELHVRRCFLIRKRLSWEPSGGGAVPQVVP